MDNLKRIPWTGKLIDLAKYWVLLEAIMFAQTSGVLLFRIDNADNRNYRDFLGPVLRKYHILH
ncbi:hypothetical protein [Membranihabitans maritimus]|uniref:hypothetical protein n=1 Tax=Membranihabitans maritimus TaxID=2904244 RepID=UPI001F239F0D|nr:hypothetical protein [Membranihabitans maritimus]